MYIGMLVTTIILWNKYPIRLVLRHINILMVYDWVQTINNIIKNVYGIILGDTIIHYIMIIRPMNLCMITIILQDYKYVDNQY